MKKQATPLPLLRYCSLDHAAEVLHSLQPAPALASRLALAAALRREGYSNYWSVSWLLLPVDDPAPLAMAASPSHQPTLF